MLSLPANMLQMATFVRHIWVTYEPALEFLQRVNQTRSAQNKKKTTRELASPGGRLLRLMNSLHTSAKD
jgi:hypothetical protein